MTYDFDRFVAFCDEMRPISIVIPAADCERLKRDLFTPHCKTADGRGLICCGVEVYSA